jgi:hypothetical protein
MFLILWILNFHFNFKFNVRRDLVNSYSLVSYIVYVYRVLSLKVDR